MAGYPSPVLITGAGSELAQGLRARLEARGVSCFMACRSEKSLLACRGKGQAAALLTHPEDLPELCREALGSGPEGLADFQHSPFESLLAQASPSAIEEWAAGDIALRARVLRALSRSMLARRRGRCLFISSAAAESPRAGTGLLRRSQAGRRGTLPEPRARARAPGRHGLLAQALLDRHGPGTPLPRGARGQSLGTHANGTSRHRGRSFRRHALPSENPIIQRHHGSPRRRPFCRQNTTVEKNMDRKNILEGIIRIAADIFECPASTLGEGTRLFTDLPCESIDLLEIAARISQEFHIQVDDDAVFLRSLRPYLEENRGQGGTADLILKKYPWLSAGRAAGIASALGDPSPLVTLGDVASYTAWAAGIREKA